jgi:carbamoyltransferase
MKILGVRHGHDSAAAVIIDGEIIADAAEERFTRVKNDTSFPIHSIEFCLDEAGIGPEDIDCLAMPTKNIQPEFPVFFSMPESAEISSGNPAAGIKTLARKMLSVEPKKNLPVLPLYRRMFRLSQSCQVHLCEHHLAHAASACYTSGLNNERSLVVTMDGRGDNVSTGVWLFEDNKIKRLLSYDGSSSIGYFYSNATEGLGWKHGCDEWKVMGLAPYGKARPGALRGFYPEFKDGVLITPHEYGEFGRWNDHGSNHYHGRDSFELSEKVKELGREDFAAEVQRVAEEQAMNIIVPWLKKVNTRRICCAGGFFLNVKFNQRLWYTGLLDTHWTYPNPGDAGLAVGAALSAYYSSNPGHAHKPLTNLYFGPGYSSKEIKETLESRGIAFRHTDNPALDAARYIADGYVIGWFQGRMESGPRALGGRSILMSPLKAENKDLINKKIKYREPFRPFCPSILYEKASDYLINPREELFMVTSFDVKENKRNAIPAVVHVDGTVRPQMVKKEVNPLYHELIKAFGDMTGEYVVLNTSFNIKGEPIVCNPREAIKCFYDTGMDVLVMGNYIIEKPTLENRG